MKTKNYKCSDCNVCSYCLQHRAPGHLCEHPIEPIYGHCMHNKDIKPEDCGLCVDKEKREKLAEEKEYIHTILDAAGVPRLNTNGDAYPLVGRVRVILDRMPGKLNAVGGFGDVRLGIDWGQKEDQVALMVVCSKGHAFDPHTVEAVLLQKEGFCQICSAQEKQLEAANDVSLAALVEAEPKCQCGCGLSLHSKGACDHCALCPKFRA